MKNDEIITNEIYRFKEKEPSDDVVSGELKKKNDLKNVNKLINAGLIGVYRDGGY